MRTIDEYEAAAAAAHDADETLVVLVGSAKCTRCPAAQTALEKSQDTHRFSTAKVNVLDCEDDLVTELGVNRLPSLLFIVKSSVAEVIEAATPEQVAVGVASHCRPILVLDEEF